MSLIENALNKAGKEIRDPSPSDGIQGHQSLKNILRLPSPSNHTPGVLAKVAIIAVFSVILLGGIVCVVMPGATPTLQRPAIENQRDAAPSPAPAILDNSDRALERKAQVVSDEEQSAKKTGNSPSASSNSPEKNVELVASIHAPAPTVSAELTAAPTRDEPGVEPHQSGHADDPDRNSFLMKKAYLYGETGKHLLALRCYNTILSQNRNHYDALLNRGIINQKLGYLEDAAGDFQHALDLNPEDPDPVLLNSLGVLYLNSGRVEQGRQFLLAAGTTAAMINLARYYWSTGSWSKVESTLQDAQRIDGECPYASYYMGLYYRERKNPEEARSYLDHAVRLARKRGLTEIVYAAQASTGVKNPGNDTARPAFR